MKLAGPLSLFNGHFFEICQVPQKNSSHFTTDIFRRKLGTPHFTTDNFFAFVEYRRKNISYFPTDKFLGKIKARKKSFHFTTGKKSRFVRAFAKKFPFTLQRTLKARNAGMPLKKPKRKRPRLSLIWGAVVSADMRFERIASTAGVRTHGENELFGRLTPRSFFACWDSPKPF